MLDDGLLAALSVDEAYRRPAITVRAALPAPAQRVSTFLDAVSLSIAVIQGLR